MAKINGLYQSNIYTPRSMVTELDFSMGMKFINSVEEDKYVRALVNFDIKELGVALVPRRGLRTYEVCIPTANHIQPGAALFTSPTVNIFAAKACVEFLPDNGGL